MADLATGPTRNGESAAVSRTTPGDRGARAARVQSCARAAGYASAHVADYQNPAGRLHELLTRFGAHPNVSIQSAWADVLAVSEGELALYLGEVALLLRDVRDAAEQTGNDAFEPIPGHLTTLSRSIFPVDAAFGQPASDVPPDPTAMQMLKALSAYLETAAPEGKIPEAAEVEGLRMGFVELLEDVTTTDLPPDIRRALLHRLTDIIAALEHLNVGGPDAVRRAAEALAISALLYEEDAHDDSGVFTKIRAAAQKAWVAFTVTTALANAVINFDRITGVELLPAGQEQRQLPSGPPPGNDSHSSGSRVEPS